MLQARDTVVEQVLAEAKQNLGSLAQNKDKYRALLESLILQVRAPRRRAAADAGRQGLFQLMESEVVVTCRKQDVSLVSAALAGASSRYEKEMHHPVALTVNGSTFLRDDRSAGPPSPREKKRARSGGERWQR